jgi:hypothetical protein
VSGVESVTVRTWGSRQAGQLASAAIGNLGKNGKLAGQLLTDADQLTDPSVSADQTPARQLTDGLVSADRSVIL